MKNVKTYSVGNGEITLSAQDAEELRRILQTEHLENTIRSVLDEHKELFSFGSPASRNLFVSDMVLMNSDCVDYDSSYYSDMLLENMIQQASAKGCLNTEEV